jgi:hypothetical protein
VAGGALSCVDPLADEELKVLSTLLASVWVDMMRALRIDRRSPRRSRTENGLQGGLTCPLTVGAYAS